jgi:hypothetical protein
MLMVVLAIAATISANAKDATFHGEVTDSQCAMNVHSLSRSHKEMLKTNSAGSTERQCADYCVKFHGGDYVLIYKTDVFRLDDQELAKSFAGSDVKIVGNLKEDGKTIHIVKIEEAPLGH